MSPCATLHSPFFPRFLLLPHVACPAHHHVECRFLRRINYPLFNLWKGAFLLNNCVEILL